ncbi:uncharacterized protein B0H18DRAFT_526859 [Fomitopsis serialis]|uniref:uncharacterized protein n=1 Tax=Fomitopsis serialis TaxID=139415 RepID=UPI002008B643|nr:uncharacterized protein B0H18DRAFT_526859 [Neoantrodia serialis]KAH9922072.1 hypothetical protein B0H18DRAFT_526859 [Neoantrodia serialis]
MATRPGHLLSRDHHDDFVEIVEISDDEVESPASPTAAETLSVEEGAEASVADDSGEETQTNEDEERSEVPDVQELMTGSAVAFDSSREYSDQRTVDELYADIDAYIASAEQNLLAESESLDMQVPANAADDVFIRDFSRALQLALVTGMQLKPREA